MASRSREGRRNQKMRPKVAAALSAITLAAVLVLSTAGCSVGAKTVEYRDPSVPIVVEKGEEFTIVLESNPSTGYGWRLGRELDAKIVTLEKVEFKEQETERLGQPGEEKWTFKAAGLGRTEIVLTYARPWGAPPKVETLEKEASKGSPGAEEEGAKESVEGEEATAPESSAHPGEEEEVETQGETGEATAHQELSLSTSEEAEEKAGELEEEKLVFSVWVKEKGAGDKEPKKYKEPAETVEVKEGYRFSIVLDPIPPPACTGSWRSPWTRSCWPW
jgi:inhibitor of cysteine peptidase